MEYFKTFNKDRIAITSNKKRITHSKYGCINSVYGSFVIDNGSNNQTVTQWIFKIHSIYSDGYVHGSICIGFDSSNKRQHINTEFYHHLGTYGYKSNGCIYSHAKQ